MDIIATSSNFKSKYVVPYKKVKKPLKLNYAHMLLIAEKADSKLFFE